MNDFNTGSFGNTEAQREILRRQRNDASFANIFEELKWRGLISVSTDEGALAQALSGRGDAGACKAEETSNVSPAHEGADANSETAPAKPLTYYCGFDPTASSLHLGHLVQLLFMRRLQLAGHHPIAVVGGSTGLVGDPRPTAERTLHSRETVREWTLQLAAQISRFLSFEGETAVRLVNNLDWTAPLSAIDFLRDIGKFFRVGAMLKKDAVATRLASEEGISYTEFSYQILQGYDYLKLYEQYGCTLQSGGQDQWGNLVSGIDLIRKVKGVSVHAVGTPIITNSDGTKFGKSEGNAIWLDPDLCSPYTFYQFWLNQADADVIDRLKVFTFLSRSEIEEYAQQVEEEPHKRAAQRRLAYEVTALVHGQEITEAVIEASAALFGSGSYESVSDEVLLQAVSELERVEVNNELTVAQALLETKLVSSLSEARRTISQGGASVNGEKVSDPFELVHERMGARKVAVLGRGKKQKAALLRA